MDRLIINKIPYLVTDKIYELPIALAKQLEAITPKNSWYRKPKDTGLEYDDAFARKVLCVLSQIPEEVLDKCDNIYHVYNKFCHQLMFHLFNPQESDIHTSKKTYKKLDYVRDMYVNETIEVFSEASELLLKADPISISDYFLAIYLRKKGKPYNEKEALDRLPFMNTLMFDVFVQVLNEHNIAAIKIKEYHPKIFQGDGEGKGMQSLLSTVAEKGVFNNAKKTPLQSVKDVKVCDFFDYVETIL